MNEYTVVMVFVSSILTLQQILISKNMNMSTIIAIWLTLGILKLLVALIPEEKE
tara:strand:- start:1226 stop:1387 length:162 start_codon:yes stop_codon:yes gene_type:complete